MSASSSTPITSNTPIADPTSGLPCSIPRWYMIRTGDADAPSGPPPPVNRYGSVKRFAPVTVASNTTKVVAGRTPGTVTLRNDFQRPAPSIDAAS